LGKSLSNVHISSLKCRK